MAIKEQELQIEKDYLRETKNWIKVKIEQFYNEEEDIKDNLDNLKKQSNGTYSEEVVLKEKVFEINHKKLERFNEGKNSPYFGRIDFKEDRRECESFYIGKFALGDIEEGEEKVIDWRAPIADLYYSGTQGRCYYTSPFGVINGQLNLKRKLIIREEELVDAFDEGINELMIKGENGEENTLIDEFLRINLEESISSKLKDVVATIQKEQNDVIRIDKNFPVIVQGSAGSGKTTIALHRLAYLLYKFKENIDGEDILVIAPNKIFLDYISDVLPGLGVEQVNQMTFEEFSKDILKFKQKVYTKDKKIADIIEYGECELTRFIKSESKLKGTKAFKIILDRYISILEFVDSEVEDIFFQEYLLFSKKEIKRLYMKDMINLPLNKRKAEIKKYFLKKSKEKISTIYINIDKKYDEVIKSLKTEELAEETRREKIRAVYAQRDSLKKGAMQGIKEAIKKYFEQWEFKDIYKIYLNLFKDKDIFNEVTSGKVPEDLYNFILKNLEKNKKDNIIDEDDLVPLLYLKIKIDGLSEKYKFKHIVIDEAQDYNLIQFEIFKQLSFNNSLTIVGDISQSIYFYKGLSSWEKLNTEVFEDKAKFIQLSQSYRSTVEIINFANKVLEKQENYYKSALPVLRRGKEVVIESYKEDIDFIVKVDSIIKDIEKDSRKTTAVICKTFKEAMTLKNAFDKNSEHKWTLIKDNDKKVQFSNLIIPVYMAKGLEFDCSIIYNCSKNVYVDTEMDKKLLYVAFTRALHNQYVFFKEDRSILINDIIKL